MNTKSNCYEKRIISYCLSNSEDIRRMLPGFSNRTLCSMFDFRNWNYCNSELIENENRVMHEFICEPLDNQLIAFIIENNGRMSKIGVRKVE